jgi:hypothetical protein
MLRGEQVCLLAHDLLGYDLQTSKAIEGGGIFGYISYLIYQCHDQARGGIHIHILGKIVGSTDPDDLRRKLDNSIFKEKYLVHVESIVQAKTFQHCDHVHDDTGK